MLFHLTDEHLDGVLGFVRRHLASDGAFYANVALGEQEPGQWREFPMMFRTLEQYHAAAAAAGLSCADLGELHEFGYDSVGKYQNMLRFT